MNEQECDILIIGAGPVGMMCSYLAKLCGLNSLVLDKSEAPLTVGRADALNARTLQLLELAKLFKDIYPLGKTCNTSSVWKDGKYLSRQSSWWDSIEGSFHKHFLMLGQAHLENVLDKELAEQDSPVLRCTEVASIELKNNTCETKLSNGNIIKSKYVIGADGSRSFVRNTFKIPFVIEKPQIVWAVIDAEIETTFQKVPEIIVFQNETSDVAWIPREGVIDRFYIRMDRKDFTMEEALERVNLAMKPHTVKIKKLVWFSQFSVKESVAEKFFVQDRVFLAGDSCHIHSVNGGQGLNTGLADAFNLIWKINMVLKHGAKQSLLETYEAERKPVAISVIESSGELVRSTKYAESANHAENYVKIVEKRSGNITGMGIRYGEAGLVGQRLFDFEVSINSEKKRIYSLLDYKSYTLLVFGKSNKALRLPKYVQTIELDAGSAPYDVQAMLVRPDSYIAAHGTQEELANELQRTSTKIL